MRIASVLAATTAAFGLVVAPVAAADNDEEPYASAIVTIGNLEAQGYTVNVDRVGSAPLEDCVVTDIRNPQEVTRLVRVGDDHDGGWHGDDDNNNGDDDDGGWNWSGNHGGDWVEVVVKRTITVSLNCTT